MSTDCKKREWQCVGQRGSVSTCCVCDVATNAEGFGAWRRWQGTEISSDANETSIRGGITRAHLINLLQQPRVLGVVHQPTSRPPSHRRTRCPPLVPIFRSSGVTLLLYRDEPPRHRGCDALGGKLGCTGNFALLIAI